MNKSKFLKKSLAMLLALMLVVAMIPLSASAAEPSVAKVLVNETEAKLSGTNYSAEIVDPGNGDVTIKVELANGTGSVAHYVDKNQLDTSDATENSGVWSFKMTKEEKAAKIAEFVVVDTANQQKTTYTVSYTVVEADTDTAVESIHLDDAVEGVEYGEAVLEGDTYVLTAPYGYTITSGTVKVTPSASTSSVKLGNGTTATKNSDGSYDISLASASYDQKVAFSVVAQSGDVKNYYVVVTEPKPFASFSIEGERHTSQISRVTEEPSFVVNASQDPQVEVYLPYGEVVGTNGAYMFTPVFETNYNVVVKAVRESDSAEIELVSGESYNLADFANSWSTTTAGDRVEDATVDLKVYYNSESTAEDWELNFDALAAGEDPVAAIKSLTVDNYQATIDGNNISIALPENIRKDTTKTIKLGISQNVNVEVVNNSSVADAKNTSDDTGASLTGVDLTANSYTLRVTAAKEEFDQTAKQVKDYYLTISTAEVQAPKMTAAYLQNADGSQKITGTIGTNTITFAGIPYSYKSVQDMADDGWKLFWTASSGCTVTSNSTPIDQTGSKVDDTKAYLPDSTSRFDNTKATQTIDVSNGTSTQSYTVVFDSADASHNSTLGTVQLAKNDVTSYDDLNDTNTVEMKVSGNQITGEIYYSDWAAYTSNRNTNGYRGAAVVTTLPTGAEIFFVNETSDNLYTVSDLNEVNDSVTTWLPAIGYSSQYYYGKEYPTSNFQSSLQIVVVSEALAETINQGTAMTTLETEANKGLYTIYELTLTQKAPRNGNTITEFSVLDAYTGNVAKAQIKGDEINLELPYYFVDSNRKSNQELYLDFTINEGGATVKNATNDSLNGLVYDLDGNLVKADSIHVAWNSRDEKLEISGSNDIDTITVTAEDGNTRANPYTLNVTIADPEEAAVLNSVSINNYTGTPDAQGNVTITLPYGTEVTKLNPKFNVSTNAYVIVGDKSNIAPNGTNMVDADSTYNFLNPRTFTVVSEDGKATNTYTITVKVADQFTDVNPDDWFYENVMGAAANGYVTGEGNGIFNPYGKTTRAAFAAMIANVMGFDPENDNVDVETAFVDVPSSHWGAKAIAFCVENGYLSGYEDGTFQPDKAITRQEAAAILNNTFELEASSDVSMFTDAGKIASWATAHVGAVANAELMNGDAAGTFRPTDYIIRAEAASILMNAKNHGYID